MDAAIFVRVFAGSFLACAMCAASIGCQAVPWPFAAPESVSAEKEVPATEIADPADQATNQPDSSPAEQQTATLPVAGLADDRWVMNVRPLVPGVSDPPVRWHHLALDVTLAASASKRPDLSTSLTNPNPVVAANAAIMIGRWNADAPIAELDAAIRNENMKLPLRQAAIETLGMIQSNVAKHALDVLLAETDGNVNGERSITDVPEIHAELLYARAKHISALAEPRFTTALKNKSPLVRLEAASAWARNTAPALDATPMELLDLASDSDTRVRVAALRAAAVNRHPRAVEYLARATRDFDMSVRLAAIAGLGELGTEEAKRTLEKLRKDPSEIARAATVGALAALGVDEALVAAASDRSSRVRQAVADSLKDLSSDAKQIKRDSAALARQLVQDTSSEVQRRAIKSLSEWPLEQAGPPLLLAMEQGTWAARQMAAAQLAERWPPAKEFSPSASDDRRAEQLDKLRKQWEREFGRLDQLVVQAAATEVVRATGLSEEHVELLEQLAASDSRERRQLIAELARRLDGQRLSDLALERLAQLVENETDPLVWQAVLDLLVSDPRQVAARLAYVAVGNASSEVRRRACEYLQTHANPRHMEVLKPMLDDPNVTVAIAAVRAIGAAGVGDPEPLLRLLNVPDKQLRLETAIVLAQSNIEAGFAAIERLSRETDLEIRRAATVAMGEIGDPVFLPALMLLVEDRRDIQIAAMASLVKIAGRDVTDAGDESVLPDEKTRRWKRWYSEQNPD